MATARLNPAAAVDPPRVQRHAIVPLNVEQSKALLAATALDDDYGPVVAWHHWQGRGDEPGPYGAAVATALLTGLRIGEVLGFAWSSVDLDKRQARVRQSVQQIKGQGDLA